MILTRRSFLKLAGAEALSFLPGCRRQTRILDRTNFSLEQIMHEEDNPKHKGFPTRVKEAGFGITHLFDKGSNKQVVIFGEEHKPETERNISGLIDILVSEYGFDSIGIEGYYGEASSSLIERVSQDLFDTLGNTRIQYKWKANTLNGVEEMEVDMDVLTKDSRYERFLRQKSATCYGIEDREGFLTAWVLITYTKILENILKIKQMCKERSTEVPIEVILQANEILSRLRDNHPYLGLPPICFFDILTEINDEIIAIPKDIDYEWHNKQHTSFHKWLGTSCVYDTVSFQSSEEFLEHRNYLRKTIYSLYKKKKEHIEDKRTDLMTREITRKMEELHSKRGIIIAGAMHIYSDVESRTYEGLIHDEPPTIPRLLPYSSLTINASNRSVRQ